MSCTETHAKNIISSTLCPYFKIYTTLSVRSHKYLPAAHDASRHHTHRVESGDEIGGGGGEVEGEDHGQLEEHGIVDL